MQLPSHLLAGIWENEAASQSPNTIRSYRYDFDLFRRWIERQNTDPAMTGQLTALPAPPVAVAAYITWLADPVGTDPLGLHLEDGQWRKPAKASTIARHLASIKHWHDEWGSQPQNEDAYDGSPTDHPRVRRTHAGLRRTLGTRQEGVDPILLDELSAMIDTRPDSVKGARDAALLAVGFFGALRRSELVGLQVGDLDFSDPRGVKVLISRSKTDQEGAGVQLGIYRRSDVDTPSLLRRWLHASDLSDADSTAPLFQGLSRAGVLSGKPLTPQSVNLVVKQAAEEAGIGDGRRLGGHSLRKGFATWAALSGVPKRLIQRQTRHASASLLRSTYIEPLTLFDENATTQGADLTSSRTGGSPRQQ